MDSPQLLLSLVKVKDLAASGQEKATILDIAKKSSTGELSPAQPESCSYCDSLWRELTLFDVPGASRWSLTHCGEQEWCFRSSQRSHTKPSRTRVETSLRSELAIHYSAGAPLFSSESASAIYNHVTMGNFLAVLYVRDSQYRKLLQARILKMFQFKDAGDRSEAKS